MTVTTAAAGNQPSTAELTQQTRPKASVLVSPAFLAIRTAVITVELPLGDTWSTGAIVAYGEPDIDILNDGSSLAFFAGGAQLWRHLTGDFRRGVRFGASALFVRSSSDGKSDNGLVTGPMAAYKYSFDAGLTLEAQLGVGLIADEDDLTVRPIGNFGVGWTL
jgi:hypothetical protein